MEVSDREGGHVKAETDCMAWFSINSLFCHSNPNWTLGLTLKHGSPEVEGGSSRFTQESRWGSLLLASLFCVKSKAT